MTAGMTEEDINKYYDKHIKEQEEKIRMSSVSADNLIRGERIGEEAYQIEITKEECLPMDFTGRPMKGYIFITPDGFDITFAEMNKVEQGVISHRGKAVKGFVEFFINFY